MKYRTHEMRFSYSVRGIESYRERAVGTSRTRARGSKRVWIEVPDITRRSRRRDHMIDARWLCQSCVRERAHRVATCLCVICV